MTGIGVAFSKNDTRGLAAQLNEVFEQMREDGSMEKLVGKYLDDPAHSLEVDALEPVKTANRARGSPSCPCCALRAD